MLVMANKQGASPLVWLPLLLLLSLASWIETCAASRSGAVVNLDLILNLVDTTCKGLRCDYFKNKMDELFVMKIMGARKALDHIGQGIETRGYKSFRYKGRNEQVSKMKMLSENPVKVIVGWELYEQYGGPDESGAGRWSQVLADREDRFCLARGSSGPNRTYPLPNRFCKRKCCARKCREQCNKCKPFACKPCVTTTSKRPKSTTMVPTKSSSKRPPSSTWKPSTTLKPVIDDDDDDDDDINSDKATPEYAQMDDSDDGSRDGLTLESPPTGAPTSEPASGSRSDELDALARKKPIKKPNKKPKPSKGPKPSSKPSKVPDLPDVPDLPELTTTEAPKEGPHRRRRRSLVAKEPREGLKTHFGAALGALKDPELSRVLFELMFIVERNETDIPPEGLDRITMKDIHRLIEVFVDLYDSDQEITPYGQDERGLCVPCIDPNDIPPHGPPHVRGDKRGWKCDCRKITCDCRECPSRPSCPPQPTCPPCNDDKPPGPQPRDFDDDD